MLLELPPTPSSDSGRGNAAEVLARVAQVVVCLTWLEVLPEVPEAPDLGPRGQEVETCRLTYRRRR